MKKMPEKIANSSSGRQNVKEENKE
jgi:hypothetical protein